METSVQIPLSMEAAHHIENMVRRGHASPNLKEMVPVLTYCATYCERLKSGEKHSSDWPHFAITWGQPWVKTPETQLDANGSRVFVSDEAVEALEGRRLVLEWVDVSAMSTSPRMRELLVAE